MLVGELLVCLEINTGISGWVKNFLFLVFHMKKVKILVMARTELPENKRMRRKSINIIQTFEMSCQHTVVPQGPS